MDKTLPGIVVTGASGFIGRHFVIALAGKYRLFCIARRSKKEAGIPKDDNIIWLPSDICDEKNLSNAVEYINENGGADYVFHLAAYYDFDIDDNPAYELTNVKGTENVLKMSLTLKAKRFIFISSLAACRFSPENTVIDEDTPADATFPYAKSKRKGEEIVRQYSDKIPCSVIRLAAVYSDWCEYPPLYSLLETWLSGGLMSKILGGKGESAIPYIHIKELIAMFLKIIQKSSDLPRFAIYLASPDGSVSHSELFSEATKYFFNRESPPFRMPKVFASTGLIMMDLLGKITGRPRFEKPWMGNYIDRKLCVNASKTRKELGWRLSKRYNIKRRLLFMTERMKYFPDDWRFRNELLLKRYALRSNIIIFNVLEKYCEANVGEILKAICKSSGYPNYKKMDKKLLEWYISLKYKLIAVSARSTRNPDRILVMNYAQMIASRRFKEGFSLFEVKKLMNLIYETMVETLLSSPELKGNKESINNYIGHTIQLAIDEIEDTFASLKHEPPENIPDVKFIDSIYQCHDLKRVVRQIEDICGDSMDTRLGMVFSNPSTIVS